MMPSEASDHPRTVLYKTLCIFMKILTKLSESNQPRKTRIYRILEHVTFDTGNEIPEIKLELRGLQIRLNCASMTDRYANQIEILNLTRRWFPDEDYLVHPIFEFIHE